MVEQSLQYTPPEPLTDFTKEGVEARLENLGAYPPLSSSLARETTGETSPENRGRIEHRPPQKGHFTPIRKFLRRLAKLGIVASIPFALAGDIQQPQAEDSDSKGPIPEDTTFRPNVLIPSYDVNGRRENIQAKGMMVLSNSPEPIPGIVEQFLITKATGPKDVMEALQAGDPHRIKKKLTDIGPLSDEIRVVAVNEKKLRDDWPTLRTEYSLPADTAPAENLGIAFENPSDEHEWPFFYKINPQDVAGMSQEEIANHIRNNYEEDIGWNDELVTFVAKQLFNDYVVFVNNFGSSRGDAPAHGIVVEQNPVLQPSPLAPKVEWK
ncbi:MAG: hypothetical protein ACOCXQ_01190 [Patescibacteria group bacterium]